MCITACHAASMGLHPGPECFIEPLIVNFLLGFPAAWRQKAPGGSEAGFRIGEGKMFSFASSSFVPCASSKHRPSPPRQHNYPYSGSFFQ